MFYNFFVVDYRVVMIFLVQIFLFDLVAKFLLSLFYFFSLFELFSL